MVGATLHDGQGGDPIEDSAVLIQAGRIVAVGTRENTQLPANAEIIDCRGRHLTPGLIDTHVHYSQTGWADGRPDALDVRSTHPYEEAMAENAEHPERFHRAFLAAGVTAVFDVGGYPWTRDLGDATENDPFAPHVAATGALITPFVPAQLRLPDQEQFVLMEDEQAVRAAVRSHAELGSDAIKVWFVVRGSAPTRRTAPLVMAAGDEARKQGLPLVVHATTLETARIAVAAGARLLVHSVQNKLVDDDFIDAMVEQGTFYCPTLTVSAGYFYLRSAKLSPELRAQLDSVHPSVASRARATDELKGAPASRIIEAQAKRVAMQSEIMADNLLRVHEAGVPVVMGTDAGNPLTLHGPSVYPEMEAMQAAGLTPDEVLVASTRDAARAMGRGDDLGVIAAGRIADLLVLEEDPSEDITNMRTVLQICRAGVLHDRAELLRWK